jgi:hypothetical protein
MLCHTSGGTSHHLVQCGSVVAMPEVGEQHPTAAPRRQWSYLALSQTRCSGDILPRTMAPTTRMVDELTKVGGFTRQTLIILKKR